MKATVTEKHLDAAIAVRDTTVLSRNCVAAQLCMEIYGDRFDGCATGVVCLTNGVDLKIADDKFNNLISKYDLRMYDDIRPTLPMEVELPDMPIAQ